MKTRANISNKSRSGSPQAGILLIECLVYIAVFSILMGIGTASFYLFWDYSKSLRYATEDVGSALRAGEGWRADVRAASGKIVVEKTNNGVTVRMPERKRVVVYRLAGDELRREIPAEHSSRVVLAKVKTSEMQPEPRGGVAAWRWELELTQRRPQMRQPLLFTFEAVANQP